MRASVERTVEDLIRILRTLASQLDPATLSARELRALFERLAEAERLIDGAKLALSPALARSGDWRGEGLRSPEDWIARTTGTSAGEARRSLETAQRLEQLDATRERVLQGDLSLPQAAAIAEAATVVPEAEASLLEAATTEPVGSLQQRARRTILDSRGSAEERYARQVRLRSFRHWVDEEGMVAGRFRLPPDVGSALVKTVQREADRHFRRAHRDGRREAPEAYAADAFAGLVTGEDLLGPRSRRGAEVVVVVSYDALRRGFADGAAGEICEVPGFGAVSVARARELLADAFLKGVVAAGTRITHVRHFGRHRPAEVDTALLATAVLSKGRVECCVEGCGRTVGIEWDHAVSFARGGPTTAANLQPMCDYDNRLKARGGVVHSSGQWRRRPRKPPP